MEEKHLDFNQRFLSVRRYPLTPTPAEAQERRRKVNCSVHKLPPLPYYKSELKSGPVGNPGKVPFVWETFPGKPKEEKELPSCTALDCRPAVPKLPPGSSQKVEVINQGPSKDSKVVVAIHSQVRTETHSVAEEVAKPVTKHEGSGDGGNSSSVEGDDEAFVDALETFSRSDSLLNCSMTSGLSGFDGPDLRSLGRFNTNQVARDFMMDRFLPAAKAMASEAPQHTTRKPLPLAKESPRREMVPSNWLKIDSPTVEQNGPMIPLRYILNGFGGESDDDDGDYYENAPAKVCGLLPRFCLLSSVPGIKHMQPPRAHSARRMRGRYSYKYPVVENRTKRSPSKELKEDKLDSRRKFSEIKHEKDGKRLDGSNLYRWLQGNGQFPKQKEMSLREAFEAEGSAGTASEELNKVPVDCGSSSPGKQCMNFRELLASEGGEWESGSTGPVAERTLYVDYVQLVGPQDPSTHSSDSMVPSNHDDLEAKNAALLKSTCPETGQSDLPCDKMIAMEEEEIKKHVNPVLCDMSDCGAQVRTMKSSGNEREFTAEAEAKNSEEAYNDGKINLDSQSVTNSVGREISLVSTLSFHVPPPLPKSPSDSWLSRTLHAVSSKSSSSAETPLSTNIVLSRAIASKPPPTEAKWETIVRTSNTHHGHLRFSKELLPPVPEA